MKAYLILEDGSIFIGEANGVSGDVITRLFFNTRMAGYLEVITDPAVSGRAAVFTYPVLGNYGVNSEDAESCCPRVCAVIAREISANASNFRSEGTLGAFLAENSVPVLTGIDTRKLTRLLREKGKLRALITANPANIAGDGLEQSVIRIKAHSFSPPENISRETAVLTNGAPRAAILDLGCRNSFIETVKSKYGGVKIYNINDADLIPGDKPDRIFISSGPGDPRKQPELTAKIKSILESGIPVTGIALGHLLVGLALGAEIRELQPGRHGANLPVKDLRSGLVYTTTQSADYEILSEGLENIAEITHVNINDGGIEGLAYKNIPVKSFAFYPEGDGAPGTGFYLDNNN